MVPKESIDLRGREGGKRVSTLCRLDKVERAASGAWAATYRVEISVDLADGRCLEFVATQRLRGRQYGSKPRGRAAVLAMNAKKKGA
jgi:hypothetical protein